MGQGYCKLTFKTTLPSFATIQSLYYAQTGLHLKLKSNLYLSTLKTSFPEILALFQQDADAVIKLENEKQEFYQAHAYQYEVMAKFHNKTKEKLRQLSYIDDVQLIIEGFYEVNFSVNENSIEIETYHSLGYGIDSLIKVLIDLGGILEEPHPEKWKKFKKWHEYKWYNRPKK